VSIGVKSNRINNPLSEKQLKNYSNAVKLQHLNPSEKRLAGYKAASEKLKNKKPTNMITFTNEENILILDMLKNNMSYNKIAQHFGYCRPTISKHIKTLIK
jgi:transcriptional antiterminator